MAKKSPPAEGLSGGAVCENCLYWRRMQDEPMGECYFNPPHMQLDEEGYALIRPMLEATEHACGHFKGGQ